MSEPFQVWYCNNCGRVYNHELLPVHMNQHGAASGGHNEQWCTKCISKVERAYTNDATGSVGDYSKQPGGG